MEIIRKLGLPYIPLKPSLVAEVSSDQTISQITGPIKYYADMFGLKALKDITFRIVAKDIIIKIGDKTSLADLNVSGTVEAVTLRADASLTDETDPTKIRIVFRAVASDGTVINLASQGSPSSQAGLFKDLIVKYMKERYAGAIVVIEGCARSNGYVCERPTSVFTVFSTISDIIENGWAINVDMYSLSPNAESLEAFNIYLYLIERNEECGSDMECLQSRSRALKLLHYMKIFTEVADEVAVALESMYIAFSNNPRLENVNKQISVALNALGKLQSTVFEGIAKLGPKYIPILTVWIDAGKRFAVARGKGLNTFRMATPHDISISGRLTTDVDDLVGEINSLSQEVFANDGKLVGEIEDAVKAVASVTVPIAGPLSLAVQLQLATGILTIVAMKIANIANDLDEKRLRELLVNVSEIAISYAKADNVLIDTVLTYENGGVLEMVLPSYILVGETSDIVDMGMSLMNKILTSNLLDKELGIKKVSAKVVSPIVLDFSDVVLKNVKMSMVEYTDYGSLYRLKVKLEGVHPTQISAIENLIQGRKGISLLQWTVKLGYRYYPAVLSSEGSTVYAELYLPKVGLVESAVVLGTPLVVDIYPIVLGIEADYFQANPLLKAYQVGSGVVRLDLLKEGYTKLYGWDLEIFGVVDLGGKADVFYLLLTSDYGVFNKKGLADGLRVWGYFPYVTDNNVVAKVYVNLDVGNRDSIRSIDIDGEGDRYAEGTVSIPKLSGSVLNINSSPQVNVLDIVKAIASKINIPLQTNAFKFVLVRAVPRFVYTPTSENENPFPTVTLLNVFYPYIVYYSADDLLSFAKVYVTNVREVVADVEPVVADVVQTEAGRKTVIFAPIVPEVQNNKVELSTTGTALAPVDIKIVREGSKYVLDVQNNEVILKVPEDSNFSGIKVVLMDGWGRPLLLGKVLEDLLDELYRISGCVKAYEERADIGFKFTDCETFRDRLVKKEGNEYVTIAGRMFTAKQIGILKQLALLFEEGIRAIGIAYSLERGFYFDPALAVKTVNGSQPSKWSFYSVVIFAPLVFKFLDVLKQRLSQQISVIDTITQDIMFAFKELSALYIYREPPYAIIKNASTDPEVPKFTIEFSGSQTSKVLWGARLWIDVEGGGASVYVSKVAKPGDRIVFDLVTEAYRALIRSTPNLYAWLSEKVPSIDSILDSLVDIAENGVPSELLNAFEEAISGRDPLEILQLTPIEKAILMGYIPKVVRVRFSFEGAYVRAWKDQNGVTIDVVDGLGALAYVVDLGTKNSELKQIGKAVDTDEYKVNKRIYVASLDPEFSGVEVDRFLMQKLSMMTPADILKFRWVEIFSGLNVLHIKSTDKNEETYYGFTSLDLINSVPYIPIKRGETQLPNELFARGNIDLGNFFEGIEGVAYVIIRGRKRQIMNPFVQIPLDVEYIKVLKGSDKTIPTPTVFDEISSLEVLLGTVDGVDYWARIPVISNKEGEVRAFMPYSMALYDLPFTIQPLKEEVVKFPVGSEPVTINLSFETSFFTNGEPVTLTTVLGSNSGILNELLSLRAGDTYLYEMRPVVFLGTVEEAGGLTVKTDAVGTQQEVQVTVPSAIVRADIVTVFRPRTSISYTAGNVINVELNSKDDIVVLPYKLNVYRDGSIVTQSVEGYSIVVNTGEGRKYILLYSIPAESGTETFSYIINDMGNRIRLVQYSPYIVINASSKVNEFRENKYLKRNTTVSASVINAPMFLFKTRNPRITLNLTGVSASGAQVLNASIPLTQTVFELSVDEKFTVSNGLVKLDVQTKVIGTDDNTAKSTIKDLFSPGNLYVPIAYSGLLTADYEVEVEQGGKIKKSFSLASSSVRLPMPAVDVSGSSNEVDISVMSWATPVRKVTAVLTLVNSATDIRKETVCLVPPITRGGFKIGEPLNSVLLATVALNFNEALTRLVVVGGSAPNDPTVIYTKNSAVNLLNDVVVLTDDVDPVLAAIAVTKTAGNIIYRITDMEEVLRYLEEGKGKNETVDSYIQDVVKKFSVKEEYARQALYNILLALTSSWYVMSAPVKVQLEYIIVGTPPSGISINKTPKHLANAVVLNPLESAPIGNHYRYAVAYSDMSVLTPLELKVVEGTSEVSVTPFISGGLGVDAVCNAMSGAVGATNIKVQNVKAQQGLNGVTITVAEQIIKATGNDPTKNAIVLASLAGLAVLSSLK